MKIIKQVDVSNWKYRFTCTSCDSELEAEASDIKHTSHYDQRDAQYDTYCVYCPVCSTSKSILEKDIPKALQVKIKSKKTISYGGPFDR